MAFLSLQSLDAHRAALSRKTVRDEVAKAASGIGTLSTVKQGRGGSIILIEESHNSYRSNIDEAIFLLRLHTDCNLSNIGLEGYTEEAIPFFRRGAPNKGIAITLSKDGEINAAEFMYLGFDLRIFPIEEKNDRVSFNETYSGASNSRIEQITERECTAKITKSRNNTRRN